jgi:two-component system response regulator AtoC
VPGLSPQAAEFAELFSFSGKMRAVWDMIVQVGPTTATALIRGESGVGKDLVARAIHAMSPRAAGPYVKVNCAALPAALLESELFGHERGAFTGAFRQKPGQFEYANRGTICLDEIGELPRELQAKLLHVMQDLRFSRLGGREQIQADARVVATTNRDLEAAISQGEFREDLYYRLNVVEVVVPPLRERREAIPHLVDLFLKRFNGEYGRQVRLSAETLRLLTEHTWPGNIRELENAVRRLVVVGNERHLQDTVGRNGNGIGTAPHRLAPATAPQKEQAGGLEELGLKGIARRAARDAERAALLEVLERVRWNRMEAARVLKVSYKTLLSKLAECGIPPARSKTDS